jgi:hypothetical protein
LGPDDQQIKQRDDLISALRHAILMRRQGKPLSDCEGVGYGNMPYAKQRPERSRGPNLPAAAPGILTASSACSLAPSFATPA